MIVMVLVLVLVRRKGKVERRRTGSVPFYTLRGLCGAVTICAVAVVFSSGYGRATYCVLDTDFCALKTGRAKPRASDRYSEH